MKKYKTLSIDYYDEFECIADKCEDHCCKNWGIYIDKKTYMKYKKLKHSEFKNKLTSSIGRNRTSKHDYDYARIRLVENRCPLLSDEGLCEVYQNIGGENMSYTCRNYPRYYNLVDDTIEISLTLSCVEAAKNILLRKNPIEFNLGVQEVGDIKISKSVSSLKNKSLVGKNFNEIRTFSIWAIQNRNFSIEERLVLLGLFIVSIGNIQNDNVVIDTINGYYRNIENGYYNNALKQINTIGAIDAQLEFLTNIYTIMSNKTIKNQIYLENFINVINSLQLISENPELIKERFIKFSDTYYNSFMKKHEYIYENYLVSYMFKTLFPYGEMSLLDTYSNLVVNFSIIKMNLIGLFGHYKENMDNDRIVNFIQSFTKEIEHDNFMLDKLNRYLIENDLNTFAHMVILIGK